MAERARLVALERQARAAAERIETERSAFLCGAFADALAVSGLPSQGPEVAAAVRHATHAFVRFIGDDWPEAYACECSSIERPSPSWEQRNRRAIKPA